MVLTKHRNENWKFLRYASTDSNIPQYPIRGIHIGDMKISTDGQFNFAFIQTGILFTRNMHQRGNSL